jgi:folate-binding protein YgfZ
MSYGESQGAPETRWGPVHLPNRGILLLSGPDRVTFLQGLVSNDVKRVAPGHAVYACLLTPQGKFLHDFFLVDDGEALLIDCEADRRDDLAKRLKMYRLRSKIDIADVSDSWAVYGSGGDEDDPSGTIAFADPRIPALGRRMIAPRDALPSGESAGAWTAYERLRLSLAVPDGSRDMEVGKAILLENNIDLLNGIAWDKGCYTGQELTARTRYRGLIKKRLVPVRIDGATPAIGTPLIENGVEIGEMRSSSGDLGVALIRLAVLARGRPIALAGVTLTPEPPDYFPPFAEES